jgi:hypothetical protein
MSNKERAMDTIFFAAGNTTSHHFDRGQSIGYAADSINLEFGAVLRA